jgi:ferredoxin--NADP+ reductase
MRFFLAPDEIVGHDRVEGIQLARTEYLADSDDKPGLSLTGEVEHLSCGIVFQSIGHHGVPLPDLPFDDVRHLIPNDAGRVSDPASDTPLPGLYVAGWIKRGPSGVIGTNRPCAAETVEQLLNDHRAARLPQPTSDPPDLPDAIDLPGWNRIDAHERAAGQERQRPRVKVIDAAEFNAVARGP